MKTLLMADNNTEFLNTRAEFLERAGYHVLLADSVVNAEQILRKTWVHLAILDIRLEDDMNPDDVSGLELAKNREYVHIPKIMLTGYPSYEYVRDVMTPAVVGLPPAVNFLSKQEPPQVMIKSVEEVFALHVGINWELVIHWGERCLWTFANMATLLMPDADAMHLSNQANELDDLLRRLFYKSDQITLDRMLWRTDGRLALSVLAYAHGVADRQVLVTCGRVVPVSQERNSLEKLGLSAPAAGNPRLINHAETLHFGANCYELDGSNLETIKPFDQFFSQSATREVNAALDRLVQTCLTPWHRQSKLTRMHIKVDSLREVSPESGDNADLAGELTRKIESVGRDAATVGLASVEIADDELVIQFPKGRRHAYPNPLAWMKGASFLPLASPTLYGITLNAISAETILVDSGGQIWLTDFGAVAEGYLLTDYAALETSIKFDLLDDAITLEDLHELEGTLLSANRLNQKLERSVQQFNKVVSAVQRVRQNAASACGPDIQPYWWELLFYSTKRILTFEPGVRRTRRELVPLIHACMCMGMIGAKLTQLGQTAGTTIPSAIGIEIEEATRNVTVEGRLVSLSPKEFAALLFLWKNPGKLCTREEIVESVYGRPYEPGKVNTTDDANLNMVMSRIRDKIESEPKTPRYLIGKRGAGYILFPHGRPT